MKKLTYLLGLFIAVGLIFSSCSKDDDDEPQDLKPVVSFKTASGFTYSDATINEGESIDVGVIATSNQNSKKNLGQVKIYVIIDNVPQAPIKDTAINVASFSEDYTITFTSAFTGKLFAEVTDKDGQKNSVSFNITVQESSGPIHTYTTILLGGQSNPDAGSYYATHQNQVYKVADVSGNPANQKKVDIVFFYGTTNQYSLGAPNNSQVATAHEANGIGNWTNKNATSFGTSPVTGLDWSTVTNDGHIVANAGNLTSGGLANMLANNQIYAFETAGTSENPGKKGLFKVIEVMGTGPANRAIKIEVKIQQ